jgi:hypothetical protein
MREKKLQHALTFPSLRRVHVCMNMQVYQENLLLFQVERERERGGCGGRGEGGRALPGSDFKI